MNLDLRNIYRGIAYMHFHPEDKAKQKLLDDLFAKVWALGYPKAFFYQQTKLTDEIEVEDMSDWELKYIFR